MLISIILFLFWLSKIQNNYDKWWKKKENYLITLGVIIVIIAVFTPFIIMEVNNFSYSLDIFEDLGPVGDYFGGTTVGLLTLSSLIFVASAMFMQKQELELQRKEIEKNRVEYQITNNTMKKQSFDSTFFNMINLLQNISGNICYNKARGKEALDLLYEELSSEYQRWIREKWQYIFLHEINQKELKLEVLKLFLAKAKNNPVDQWDKSLVSENIGDEHEWDNLIINLDNRKRIDWENSSIGEKYSSLKNTPPYSYKQEYYEQFYTKHEKVIGHYFRNLYRIIKYIHEYNFSDDDNINYLKRETTEVFLGHNYPLSNCY